MSVSLAKWLPLDHAEKAGCDLAYVSEGIGPRRPGRVYVGGYLRSVNSVLAVHVLVDEGRAIAWQVTERGSEDWYTRRHMTSWAYDPRNTVVEGPADMRPGRGWWGV